jgi:hypothetical protein
MLHDDERVRIWEVDLQPGEATAPHRHEHDYILIILEGDRIAAVPHVESAGPSATYIEAEITPGSYVVMKKGEVATDEPVLVRLHSQCLTGDVFGSTRCDCGEQLELAMQEIDREGRGAIVYMFDAIELLRRAAGRPNMSTQVMFAQRFWPLASPSGSSPTFHISPL